MTRGWIRREIRWFCAVAALLVLTGCGPKHQVESWDIPITEEAKRQFDLQLQQEAQNRKDLEELQNVPEEPYRISPSDVFDFNVYAHSDMNVSGVTVTPDGYISLPLIGTCRIGNMTIPEASAYLTEQTAKYVRLPKVALIPRSTQGFAFTIGGRVLRTGRYPLTGNTRLQDAVAAAGGLSVGEFRGDAIDLADLKSAYIMRKGKILPVNFEKALRFGDHLNNIPIRNGDYIFLPSSMSSSVYVIGEVGAPRYVSFRDDMTLLKAFSFTSGLLEDSRATEVLVIRGTLPTAKVYKVNIDSIMKGKALDFPLQANDMIVVPKGNMGSYNVLLRQIMPTLQALNLLAGPFGNVALYGGN